MRARLIPLDGGAPIEIVKDMTLVGRKDDVDLRLDHKSVSKQHCIIVKTEGLLLVRDLGSTNGTRVNGQRVRRAALLPNDQLTIASFRFKVHIGTEEAAVAPPPEADQDHHTQQLDAKELAHLLKKGGQAVPKPAPQLAVQPNKLPDVYPDSKIKKE